jgi:hypothetical protein
MMLTAKRVETLGAALRWVPSYLRQRLSRRRAEIGPAHLIIALADHFEPSFSRAHPATHATRDEQRRSVDAWCREYPEVVGGLRDSDGYPFRHTYFFPAEQYDKAVVEPMAEHCRAGWGEMEVHLHHGMEAPDTPENTRAALCQFRDALASLGCLSRLDGLGSPRYAFVHGNWALANSAGGRFCGVDEEMEILADTGCYADFTLPSANSRAQVTKINALYECALPLGGRAPHRRGRDLRVGHAPSTFPLIVQGPLGLDFGRRRGVRRLVPSIEDGALIGTNPASMRRLALWTRAGVGIEGRPEWIFVKLHCHSMDGDDREAVLGRPARQFLETLTAEARRGAFAVHFVTAREMTNIILAACDGKEGSPSEFRDYRLRSISPARLP